MNIDHLLWGVDDLAEGSRELAKTLGVEPSPGGRHPGFGTHNALLALGEACYLEILARDPTQTKLRGFAYHLENLGAPRILTWAARTDDLDAVVAQAQEAGLAPGEIFALSRTRPDGRKMGCRLVEIGGHDAGALVPFFIQFDDGVPHPALHAASGCRLSKLVLRSTVPDELRRILHLLDLVDVVEIESADQEELVAELDTPNGRVLL